MQDNALPLIWSERVLAEPAAIRAALERLLGRLSVLGTTREERDTVELVTAEVFNNIAEHACSALPGASFEVRVHRGDRGLLFEILDRGLAMPDGQAPFGTRPGLLPDQSVPEGGFGWFLIRELAKDVRYERTEDENRLRFRISLALSMPV